MQQNQLQYQPYPPNSVVGNEIDLRELFSTLWRGKWVIIIMTAIFASGSVIYAIKQPNVYKADVLLAPAESSSGRGLSQMAGQLGGLAALAGVSIDGTESSQADLAVQVLKSRKFIESFIEEHNLLVPLMAAKSWDLRSNELQFNKELYDSQKDKWLRSPNGLRGVTPTAQESYKVFSKLFNVNKSKDTGLYTVSLEYYSPFMAQKWLEWLVEDINEVMRERTISETTQNLAYLNVQLQKTAVTDMRATFYRLVEEQTKSLMLAEVQEEFVFKVVDPAVIPEVKSGPKRSLICIFGTFLGFLLGVVVVLMCFYFKKIKEGFKKEAN